MQEGTHYQPAGKRSGMLSGCIQQEWYLPTCIVVLSSTWMFQKTRVNLCTLEVTCHLLIYILQMCNCNYTICSSSISCSAAHLLTISSFIWNLHNYTFL